MASKVNHETLLIFLTVFVLASFVLLSCNGFKAEPYKVPFYDEAPFNKRIEVESGLEFLSRWPNISLTLNPQRYFSTRATNIVSRQRIYDLVQTFIRNVRGFPVLKLSVPMVVRPEASLKPAWCFQPHLLRELVELELKLYRIFSQFFVINKSNFSYASVLDSYLTDIESSSIRAFKTIVDKKIILTQEDLYLYIASHPVLVYRMVRRFTEDFNEILVQVRSHSQPTYQRIRRICDESVPKTLKFPDRADLYDSMDSISRLETQSLLKTEDVAVGRFQSYETDIHMTALHSIEIAAFFCIDDHYDIAVEWAAYGLKSLDQSGLNHPDIRKFFEKVLHFVMVQHNEKLAEIYPLEIHENWKHFVFNTSVDIPWKPEGYVKRLYQLETLPTDERKSKLERWFIETYFWRVCAGENMQSVEEKSRLSCWYDSEKNLYWKIHPLKVELLNEDPPIYQIYEFVEESLADTLKKMGYPQLERSQTVDETRKGGSREDAARTSSQAWMDEHFEEHQFLSRLTKKFEMVTGLVIGHPMASEAYQVACYGTSHHYKPHLDAFEGTGARSSKGNRIVTVMAYLTNVEVGGHTGFPVFGFSARPVKGSILIWQNMLRSGRSIDHRTWHGSCPVALGVKWITTKWIYYRENMFNFKCTLNATE